MKKNEIIILVSAIVLFLSVTINILIQTGLSSHIDFDAASKYGALLGGMFSFLSVVLIYLTLKKQSDLHDSTSFENRFFELIRFHRSNVQEWDHISPIYAEKTHIKNQKVFVSIFRQVLRALKELDVFFQANTDYNLSNVLNESGEAIFRKEIFVDRNIDSEMFIKIDIAYSIVFFGVSLENKSALQRVLSKKYDLTAIKLLIGHFQGIKTKHNEKNVYFGGHQHRLGHYFRHLFQTVNYVNEYDSFLGNYNKKYEYVKLYRAQFSTYEQAIIFFNSLSELGKNWEFNQSDINKMLITKYRLIKNLPSEFIIDIDIKKFFPNIVIEGEKKDSARMDLEKKYN